MFLLSSLFLLFVFATPVMTTSLSTKLPLISRALFCQSFPNKCWQQTIRRSQNKAKIGQPRMSLTSSVYPINSTSVSNDDVDSFSQKILHSSSSDQSQQSHEPQSYHYSTVKEKRRRKLGLAKAVDRGHSITYQPAGTDGRSFQALSGLPTDLKNFIVLGIESSCDDTGAAIVHCNGTILGEALASQHEIHQAWGGVVPGLAREAHQANLESVIQLALQRAGLASVSQVDAIAVTVGPGLEICLRVGCNRAKELALEYNKPFVGVHHLEAHILMARLPTQMDGTTTSEGTIKPTCNVRAMEFPFLALLVSGGHCQILNCRGIGNYSILGGTVDDSLGEAFDKTARLLGLPVGGGGGPAMERLAKHGDPSAIPLSVPLQGRKDLDFSYSGLKSNVKRAVDRLIAERGVESVDEFSDQDKANIAASFQNVAIKHVEQRLKRAMEQMEQEGIRTLAVVGGVAANQELRSRLERLCCEREEPWTMFVPPPRLCTDQGTMSAWAAVERLQMGSSDDPHTQEVYARFPFAIVN